MKTVYVLLKRLPDEYESTIIGVYTDSILAGLHRMYAEDDSIIKGTKYFIEDAPFIASTVPG